MDGYFPMPQLRDKLSLNDKSDPHPNDIFGVDLF